MILNIESESQSNPEQQISANDSTLPSLKMQCHQNQTKNQWNGIRKSDLTMLNHNPLKFFKC